MQQLAILQLHLEQSLVPKRARVWLQQPCPAGLEHLASQMFTLRARINPAIMPSAAECSKLGVNRALRVRLALSGVTPGERVGLRFRRAILNRASARTKSC